MLKFIEDVLSDISQRLIVFHYLFIIYIWNRIVPRIEPPFIPKGFSVIDKIIMEAGDDQDMY